MGVMAHQARAVIDATCPAYGPRRCVSMRSNLCTSSTTFPPLGLTILETAYRMSMFDRLDMRLVRALSKRTASILGIMKGTI